MKIPFLAKAQRRKGGAIYFSMTISAEDEANSISSHGSGDCMAPPTNRKQERHLPRADAAPQGL
jgi:hypothetical protein